MGSFSQCVYTFEIGGGDRPYLLGHKLFIMCFVNADIHGVMKSPKIIVPLNY